MNHPILALAWQCWRMSRRWYLLVLGVILVASYKLLTMRPAGLPADLDLKAMMGVNVLMLTFALALFTTLIAISLGNKKGFPFYFEFRLPVPTSCLVLVPMLWFGLLCASLCFLPLAIYRLVYEIPFPVLPVSILIMLIVCAQLAGAWSATRDSIRTVVLMAAWFGFALILRWFRVFNFPRGNGRQANFNVDVITLSGPEYSIIILIILTLVCSTVFFVARQRHEGSWRQSSGSGDPLANSLAEPASGETSLSLSRSRITQALSFETLACPVSSPWLAEAWVELRRFGSPMLKMSLAAAVLIPFFSWLAQTSGWWVPASLISPAPVFMYFAGLGLMTINRRRQHQGYMGSFERSMAQSSRQLVLIQVGMTSLLILLSLLIVALGIGLTYWLPFSLPPEVIIIFNSVFSFLEGQGPGVIMSDLLVAFMAVPVSIAMYFSLHTCSLVWGRKFSWGVLLLLCGSIIQAFRIQAFRIRTGSIPEEALGLTVNLMTGILIVIPTVLSVFRVIQLKLLTARQAALVLLVWVSFIPFGLTSLFGHELLSATTDMVLRCFYTSLLLLPLTMSMCALWSYDRLRHR